VTCPTAQTPAHSCTVPKATGASWADALMAIHQPQTAPILPIAGVGRGYRLRRGSQIGRDHKGVLQITTAYGECSRAHWVFLRRRWHETCRWAFHHSCPDAFSVENGATRTSALTGCPSLCSGTSYALHRAKGIRCRQQINAGGRIKLPATTLRICAYRGRPQRRCHGVRESAELVMRRASIEEESGIARRGDLVSWLEGGRTV
jgi:hypothetical protein